MIPHPELDFMGLTPSRSREAAGPDAVLEILFGNWLEDDGRSAALDRRCPAFLH